MSKLKLKFSAVIFVSVLLYSLCFTSAFADYQPKTFTLSPFIGGYLFDGVQSLKARPYYGLRGGYNITENVGVEGMFGYVRTREVRSENPKINVIRYGIDGQYRFSMTNKDLIPFVSAGLGVFGFHNSTGAEDHHSYGLLSYGPGIIWAISNTIGLRADLRHLILANVKVGSNRHFNNYEGTVGLAFLFGGGEKEAASVKPVESEKSTEPTTGSVAAPMPIKIAEEHFEFDSSLVTDEAKTILKNVIQVMKDNPNMKLRIEGHASASGTVEYNQSLSERRANAVKDYLHTEGGIDSDRITTIGHGKLRPIVHEPHPEEKYSKEAKANMVTLNFEI
ncbi:MAG: OmpA family protein [Oligoflexia bacterium]|nr:OmpA family protein [Oligoflexia bacterium]